MESWNFTDLTGQKFGRLLVIARAPNDKRGKSRWLCLCECGREKTVGGAGLRNGLVQSCGCLQKERTKETKTTHGMTQTRLYNIYKDMKARCCNPNNTRYARYGGKGIDIVPEWTGRDGAKNFVSWATSNGYRDDLTLDRINNEKGYSPENCRWATNKIQQNNKRNNHLLEWNGETKTVAQWCEIYNIKHNTVLGRLERGWTVGQALTTPLHQRRKHYGQSG